MPKKVTKSAKKAVGKPAGTKKTTATKKKAAARQPAAARSRAAAATPARVMTRRTAGRTEIIGIIGGVTNEEIALKAYYLAERRRHLGLPGGPESDWLEAERVLGR
ncbi:MAG: DUF2934 domain-containing protein [Chthoniobacterales bacterium]